MDARQSPLPLLAGYRILEIGGDPAAFGGRALADLGAEVIVVSPPDAAPSLRASYRHFGKAHRNLDLTTRAGETSLAALAASVDAVLDGGAWTLPAQRGEAARTLGSLPPPLRGPGPIWVSLSPFGLSGPHAGFAATPLTNFAASGGMFCSGDPALPPCTTPGTLAEDAAGLFGALAIVAALLQRTEEADSRFIEVAVQEAALVSLFPWSISGLSFADRYPNAMRVTSRSGNLAYPVYPCKDGFVRILTVAAGQWRGLVEWLGQPEVLMEPQWADLRYRQPNQDAIFGIVSEMTTQFNKQELFLEGQRRGVAISPVNLPSDLPKDPNLKHREFFRPGVFAGASLPVAGPPYRIVLGPEPVSGHAHKPEAGGEFPLTGIRVLDVSIGAAGPELTRLLAELGAEVIKLESRQYLDFTRTNGPGGPDDLDGGPYYNETNRNKKSAVIDLKTAGGRDLARRLAAVSDVLVTNNREHAVASWGLDYASVARIRPDIVYLMSYAYGAGGEFADYQAYGANLSAAAGVTYLWNHPGQPMPVGTSLNHPDHIASKQGALAVLAALANRRRTGRGCQIELSQQAVAAGLIGETVMEWAATGQDPAPKGNRHAVHAPYGAYRCRPNEEYSGIEQWVAISVVNDRQWLDFSVAAGHPEWKEDARFLNESGRKVHEDALDALIGAWTSDRAPEEIVDRLQTAGIAAAVVQNGADHLADPHLQARGFFVKLDHPIAGVREYPGNPLRTGPGFVAPGFRAPLLGEHSVEICRDLLHLSEAEISALLEERVIAAG